MYANIFSFFKKKVNPTGATDAVTQTDLTKSNKWYNNEAGLAGVSNLVGSIGSGLANYSTIQNSNANSAIKRMNMADAGVDSVSSAMSAFGPWGMAAGLALKGFNTLGSGLISTPNAYKNFSLNNDVAKSSSMTGVANNAMDISQTVDSFKNSGFFGKLFGKKSSHVNKANDLMQKQSDSMNILDANKKAFEQATTSTDLFSTRNQFNLSGLNNFNTLKIGKNGLKFDSMGKKLIPKAQSGSKSNWERSEAKEKERQAAANAYNKKNAAPKKDAKQRELNQQRQASGQTKPQTINVIDNKNKPFDDAKKAELQKWKASQGQSNTPVQNTVTPSTKGYYNPSGQFMTTGTQQTQPKAQNVIPTKTPTSTQASTPKQGAVNTAVKPVGTTQTSRGNGAPVQRPAAKPMETVSDLWQKITGTSWAEAKTQGLTSGSLQDNLALMKRLKNGENPLATLKQEKEQKEIAMKDKLHSIFKASQQRTMDRITSTKLDATSFKKGGSITEKKCLKPKSKRSKRVEF